MMAPDIPKTKTERPQVVEHDQAPSNIIDHPFVPKGLWFTLCRHCNLAESAHAETTLKRPPRQRFHYVGDEEE